MFRVTIRLYGQVQGVNLRAVIKVKALSEGFSGYVKNKDDGSVEIVCEGEREKLTEFIRFLNDYRGTGKIERLEDYWSEDKKKYDNFTIEY